MMASVAGPVSAVAQVLEAVLVLEEAVLEEAV